MTCNYDEVYVTVINTIEKSYNRAVTMTKFVIITVRFCALFYVSFLIIFSVNIIKYM